MTPVNDEGKTDNATKPVPATSAKGAKLLAGFACILALAALLASLYNLQCNLNAQKAWQHAQHNKTHFKDQLQQIQSKEDALQQEQTRLHTALNQIPKDIHFQLYQNPQWLLLKARYYLEMAQVNAQWSNDYTSSIALLQAADALLSQANTPDTNNARQLIAKEITQLQAMPKNDKTGLLSQLDAAQASIEQLDLKKPDVPAAQPATDRSSWQGHLQTNLDQLKKLVVIQHHDENTQLVVSPALQLLLKENLRLALQQAQWAVLNDDAVLYQQALSNAIHTLKRAFCMKKQAAIALRHQLHALQKASFNGDKPVIGQAIPLLTQAINAPVSGEDKP